MSKPKVEISSLANVNMDDFAFRRNSGLRREDFEPVAWWRSISPDGWVLILCLIGIIVAFCVVERPL